MRWFPEWKGGGLMEAIAIGLEHRDGDPTIVLCGYERGPTGDFRFEDPITAVGRPHVFWSVYLALSAGDRARSVVPAHPAVGLAHDSPGRRLRLVRTGRLDSHYPESFGSSLRQSRQTRQRPEIVTCDRSTAKPRSAARASTMAAPVSGRISQVAPHAMQWRWPWTWSGRT